MKAITINNREYNIGFDFSSVLAFEQIAEKPFSSIDITSMTHSETLQLYYAAIYSQNKDVPNYLDFVKSLDVEKFQQMAQLINEAMMDFYHIPAIAESHAPSTDGAEDDGEANQ